MESVAEDKCILWLGLSSQCPENKGTLESPGRASPRDGCGYGYGLVVDCLEPLQTSHLSHGQMQMDFRSIFAPSC